MARTQHRQSDEYRWPLQTKTLVLAVLFIATTMLALTFLLNVAFGIALDTAIAIGVIIGGASGGFWFKGGSAAPEQVVWLQLSNTVLWIVFAWLSVFGGAPLGFDLFWIAASALFAGYLLVVLTNWHGWGQRVWEFWLWRLPLLPLPPYRQPRDRGASSHRIAHCLVCPDQ